MADMPPDDVRTEFSPLSVHRLILERLQKFSEPFGTKISIENNIGVIRVPPEATVDLAIPDIPGRGTK